MKSNFVMRTGKGSGVHVADEIERLLKAANLQPSAKIPRANLSCLLSSEALRNRVGISVRKGRFQVVRDETQTLRVLRRIAGDLAAKKIVLGDIWDTESKQNYIDMLDREGLLPGIVESSKGTQSSPPEVAASLSRQKPARREAKWPHLIPNLEHGIAWGAHIQRHRAIWEELQFKLDLDEHLNAVSVMLRVLLELSIDNYIERARCSAVHENDKLALKAGKVADQLLNEKKISKKYQGAVKKLQQGDVILSIDTLNRYVHSPNFSVSPEHLRMLWMTLSEFVVLCLKA